MAYMQQGVGAVSGVHSSEAGGPRMRGNHSVPRMGSGLGAEDKEELRL